MGVKVMMSVPTRAESLGQLARYRRIENALKKWPGRCLITTQELRDISQLYLQ
jgi:hypothetical protein